MENICTVINNKIKLEYEKVLIKSKKNKENKE